jgi:hypothetical protein
MNNHPVTLASADLDSAVKAILLGLTDGRADRKQWALEAALRALCTDKWVAEAWDEFSWFKGVPP